MVIMGNTLFSWPPLVPIPPRGLTASSPPRSCHHHTPFPQTTRSAIQATTLLVRTNQAPIQGDQIPGAGGWAKEEKATA